MKKKAVVNLDQEIVNPDLTPVVLERKYKLNEKGGPVIENGEPVIISETKLTLRKVLIDAVNHYGDPNKIDLGELVERGKMVNRLRESKAAAFSVPPTLVEPIKENMVKLGYTPYTILQVVEALDGKVSA